MSEIIDRVWLKVQAFCDTEAYDALETYMIKPTDISVALGEDIEDITEYAMPSDTFSDWRIFVYVYVPMVNKTWAQVKNESRSIARSLASELRDGIIDANQIVTYPGNVEGQYCGISKIRLKSKDL